VEGRLVGRTFCSEGRFVEGRFVVVPNIDPWYAEVDVSAFFRAFALARAKQKRAQKCKEKREQKSKSSKHEKKHEFVFSSSFPCAALETRGMCVNWVCVMGGG
jgi:hypothetical protein